MKLSDIETKAQEAARAAQGELDKTIEDPAKAKNYFSNQDEIISSHLRAEKHNAIESKKLVGKWLGAMARNDRTTADEITKNSYQEGGYDFATVTKDLSDGVSANGGYLVPLEFGGLLIEKKYKLPVIRARATVIPMTSNKMQVPLESTTPSTNWTAELATITQSDPTFGQLTLSVNELIAISRMSRQVLLDAAINYNLTDWIVERFAKALGRQEDTAFMAGSGTTMPLGLRTYTFGNTATQAAASLTGDDIISCYYGLGVQYRDNGVWLIHDSRLQLIRKLKDSSGRYLWADNFQSGGLYQGAMFPTLLNRPVLIQNDIPTNLGAGTNASEIYYGDMSYYLIGQRDDMFSEISTQEGASFATHRAAIKVGERLDGQLAQAEAFSQLTAVK